jgi:hypothetical protein
MNVGLGEGGKLRMSGCVINGWECSPVDYRSGKPTTGSGRGGGIYLNIDRIKEYEVDLLIEKTSFLTNNVTVGRDIYIKCANTTDQVNETLFQIDLREGMYNRTNAIWGYNNYESDPTKTEMDLLPLVLLYQAETIFVNSSFSNEATPNACGNFTCPCSSLKVGLSRLGTSFDHKLYVQTKIKIENRHKIADIELKTRVTSAEMESQEAVKQTEDLGIALYENICQFRKMKCMFPTTFSATSYFSFFRTERVLTLFSSSFQPASNVNSNSFSILPLCFLFVIFGTVELSRINVTRLSCSEYFMLIGEGCEGNVSDVEMKKMDFSKEMMKVGGGGYKISFEKTNISVVSPLMNVFSFDGYKGWRIQWIICEIGGCGDSNRIFFFEFFSFSLFFFQFQSFFILSNILSLPLSLSLSLFHIPVFLSLFLLFSSNMFSSFSLSSSSFLFSSFHHVL